MDTSLASRTSWDLSVLFTSDSDIEIEKNIKNIEKSANDFVIKWKNRNDYLESPASLLEALNDFEKLTALFSGDGKSGYFFWLKIQQNQSDTTAKAKFNLINDLMTNLSNDTQFFNLNLSRVSQANQKIFLDSELLKDYRHFLERQFENAKHLLSDSEEKILSLKNKTSYENWKEMISSLLSKEQRQTLINGKTEIKNFSEIESLISNTDKSIRDSAGEAMHGLLKDYADMSEHELNSILENKKINDLLRKFSRPDSSRIISDDITEEIVDSLIESISSKNDISKQFYHLKSRLLKLNKLKYHERNVPIEGINKSFQFTEAIEIVKSTFESLDDEFAEIFQEFIDSRKVDVFPKQGKRSGAFCVWASPDLPVFIMINYDGSIKSILTIAHEFGHAINAELSRKQNALNFNTPISTTEVASTFMEDFVLQSLLKEATDEEKLSIYMEKLNNDITTIFRQIACYKFELDLHTEFRKKGYISKEEIGSLFLKNMREYMGDYVEFSPGSENWWVYWSHIRKYFYVYSYAFGLLISKFLQGRVREDPSFILNVKEFMSSGCSLSPRRYFTSWE